jgi:putative tryptophan/tyrosine transport system ATP-binding protein
MALLELRGVVKTFNPGTPDEVRALRGVDLTVEPGSFVVMIGTNGSGKSTALNAVAGSRSVLPAGRSPAGRSTAARS